MGSKKGSARQKQLQKMQSHAGGLDNSFDNLFAEEQSRLEKDEEEHENYLRWKACESKQRYASYEEALGSLSACEAYGTKGLSIYRCPYCKGWHLTSHPQER